jgi:ribonuclease P protein component
VSPGSDVAPRPFDRSRRLRRRAEFQKVFDSGQRIRGRFITILVASGQASRARLGIVASRKLGDAVRRNRAKRLIREIFRKSAQLDDSRGVDVVVIPRVELFDASYLSLQEDFRGVLARGVARLRKP